MMFNFIPVAEMPEDGDDYIGEDGLLYCGKCHTPKQVIVPAISPYPMPCLCQCATAERDAQEKSAKEAREQMRIARMRALAFPDTDMATWTFDRDDESNPRISKIAHAYVDRFDEMLEKGKGLLLYGTVGTGKTFASACIANALIDRGIPCLVTSFPRLTNELQGMNSGRQDYIDDLANYDLLVIDDLASERDTEYMAEIVTSVINARYLTHKPLIVTTNLTAQEISHPDTLRRERVFSRLIEMCVPVEVKGDDRRKKKFAEDRAEIRKLLGV